MLVGNLTMGLTYTQYLYWWETWHWDTRNLTLDILLVVRNLNLKDSIMLMPNLSLDLTMPVNTHWNIQFACWLETLQRDWFMLEKHYVLVNFTLIFAHAGHKPYTTTCLWWLQTLHWDFLIVVTNLTMRLAQAGDKPYPYYYSCWWQILQVTQFTQRIIHDGDIPYIETNNSDEKLTLRHSPTMLSASAYQMRVTNEVDLQVGTIFFNKTTSRGRLKHDKRRKSSWVWRMKVLYFVDCDDSTLKL